MGTSSPPTRTATNSPAKSSGYYQDSKQKVCATAGVLICDADDNIIYRGGPPWEITVLSGSSHYVTWDGDGNIHIREVDHLPLTHLGLCDMSDSDMFGSSSDDDESEDSDDDLSSDDDE